MKLLKMVVKAGGKRGIGQGSPLSPLLANIYLNEVDKMLEKAKVVTTQQGYTNLEYARFADDLTILISKHPTMNWLTARVKARLFEELDKIDVQINEDKTKIIDLTGDVSFTFLGFDFRRVKSVKGKWFPLLTPKAKARKKIYQQIRTIFQRHVSQPVNVIVDQINPMLRGWVNYFRIGNSAKCFSQLKRWVEGKVRRHLMQAKGRKGFGWKRWSTAWTYEKLGLFADYQIRRFIPESTPNR